MAKVYLWGCRRNQTLPGVTAFSSKGNYKVEKSIMLKQIKWTMDPGGRGGIVSGFQLTGMIDVDFLGLKFLIPGLFWVV